MALKRIQDLTAATLPLDGTELAELQQGADSVQCTTQDIADLASAGSVQLSDVNVFTKNQSVASVNLTDGATINTDASLSNNFNVTLAGNRTLANPTNLTDGMVLNFRIKQDGTGSRTLAYGSKFKWPGGIAPVLSTAAGAVDRISGIYHGTDDVLECVAQLAFS